MPVDFAVSAAVLATALAASTETISAANVNAVKRRAKAIVVLKAVFFIGANLEN